MDRPVDDGAVFQSDSDTEILIHLVRKYIKEGFIPALKKSLNIVHGGFAFLLLQKDRLIAALDPNGIRPLCIGQLENGAYVVTSETCALDIVNAKFIRDVQPGELIVIDRDGLHIDHYTTNTQLAICSMEYIYFARPDSIIHGVTVHNARKQMGRLLAKQYPIDADMVIGVPNSSLSAASGYAEESGVTALQNLADLIYKYHVAPTPTVSETMPGLSESIATGRAAMAFDGQWTNATIMADEVEYAVAAMPRMGDTPATIMTYGGISIMNTDKKDAAWEFMKYLLSEGACQPLYESGLWLPVTNAEFTDEYVQTFITENHPENYYEAIVKPQLDGTAQPSCAATVQNFAKINDILDPALDDLWAGEKTAQECIDAVKDTANEEVQGWFGE